MKTGTRSRKNQPSAGLPNAGGASGSPGRVRDSETVLLAVLGMSPAVLTETVWALAQESPPVIPHRVVVITTLPGREAIKRELESGATGGRPGVWEELRKAILGRRAEQDNRLMLDTPRVISAPNARTGREDLLEDIRTLEESNAAANCILEELRRFVDTPDIQLTVSIAGGRKTMGALLHACLSLVGRETDRLTHVLVSEPYDGPLEPKFYFPRQSCQQLRTRGGKTVLAANARIDLGAVPFVPLRNLFERDFVRRPVSFEALVARCRKQVADLARREVRLTIQRSRRHVEINGRPVDCSPLQQVVMLYLAEAAASGSPPLAKYAVAVEPLREFALKLHQQRRPNDFNDWRHEARPPSDFDEQRLRKVLDELKNKFRKAGSEAAAILSRLPAKGRFSLDLPAAAITIRD